MSGAVTLATFPVVAYYFNQVPWMGILTNLFAIPVTGFVLVPLGLLSAVWTGGTGADSLAFGPLQETLSDWFIHGLRWCADLPGSQWHVSAPALPSVAVFYAALWLAGGRGIPKPVRRCSVTAVVCLAVWWIWSPRVGLDGDRWRVTFLDVGQGDSAVVELPDGKTVLIDGGARYERFDMGRSVVGPFLWNRGIRRLDHVIGTHPQLDHVGGLVWLLRHIDVGRYWSTGVDRQEQFLLDLQKVLREEAIPEQLAVQGDEVLPAGPCRLTILNPASSAGARPAVHNSGSWLNNQSIVSRLQCGTHAILFAADIEMDGLRRLTGEGSRPVTVVKVPHHGAKSSLDLKWISVLHPRYAVVSVGRSNSYGHPVQAVLDAYAREQAAILRTDRDGAIWVSGRVSSADLTLTRARDLLLQPVEPGLGAWPGERENWRRLLLQLREFHPLPFASVS
jgi:competence protein ComEC